MEQKLRFQRHRTQAIHRQGRQILLTLITGPTTGALYVTVDEIHDDVQAVETAQQGTRVSIKVPEKVRPSDKLFKIIPTENPQN